MRTQRPTPVTGAVALTAALAAVLLLAPAGAPAAAAPAATARPVAAPPLPTRLARALAVPHTNAGGAAALAVDLATGQTLFARNTALPLAPASNEKLPLSYALLTTLGPGYRLRTVVLGAGRQEGAVWRGDLVLRGEGDPTLSTAGLRRLARAVRALGIRRVTGGVVGDESFFDRRRTAPGWKASYYLSESAPLSALVVDGALYRGAVSANPALAAASLFRSALRDAGVAVERLSRTGRAASKAELAVLASPPLGRILRRVNGESDNLASELLLKHLGAVHLGRGTTAAGALVVRRVLSDAGVPLAGVRLVDGSGLSSGNRLTADALAAVLVAAWNEPDVRRGFLESLAVAGRRGTLARRLARPPAAGRVYAKTGTTARASSLAGYVGGRYAFVVLHNGAPVATWSCRIAQDRFVTALARA